MIDYDLELRHHNDVLRRSYGIRASDRVLDVGCGTGQTTREAARLATAGAVLGIDRSDAMIERARALARAAGLGNVEYECADVERHALPRERFDVAISRLQPFSLGDPDAVRRILDSAGFAALTFDEVRAPVYYGSDADAAFEFVSRFAVVQETAARLDVRQRERALDRLRQLVAAHRRDDGVWFDSRAWIVAARRS